MDIKPLPRNCQIPVAGVSFRQDTVRTVSVDDRVRLIADPSNPHDANAIAVVTIDGRLLGYVPSQLTGRLHATGEVCFDAVVTEVFTGDTWGLRLSYKGVSDEQEVTAPGHVPSVEEVAAATPAPKAAAGDPSAPSAGATVKTSSGRTLGTFAGVDGRFTLVEVDGKKVRYPTAVVTVDAA